MYPTKSLLAVALGAFALPMAAQRFTFLPEKPVSGEKIALSYDKGNSPLANVSDVYITAYSIAADKITAHDVTASESNGVMKGSFVVPSDARLVFFSVKNWDGDNDNNDGAGWGTPVYQASREQPVSGYGISLGAAMSIHASTVGVEMDLEETGSLFQQNFEELKGNKDLMLIYAIVVGRIGDEAGQKQVKDYARQLAAKKKAPENDWILAFQLSQYIEDEELASSVREKILKKYPKGRLVWDEKCQEFQENESEDLQEQKRLFEELLASPYAKDKEGAETISNIAATVAAACFSNRDWAGFDKYTAMIASPLEKASLFNSLAWGESGESLEAEGGELEQAKRISLLSMQLLETMKSGTVNDDQLTPYSPYEVKKILNNQIGMYADTYALLAFKLGSAEEALQYQQKACEGVGFKDPDFNERYCAYLEKAKGTQAAEAKLEELISAGTATQGMKDQYKRLYIISHSAEQASEKFSQMEMAARKQMRKELEEKMIDEEAPAFALLNLNGETVSLESLKGKVVVIDFWATWCGPCVRSFPGMQRAQNDHKEQGDVAFLFVNTWERVNDKEKNARDFISSNNYSFNVLMDKDNEVVGQFGVEGIPAKFILDGNGRIRFSSTGFNPDEDAMVQELAMMIELARGK
jgi:peroxiredoxin